MLPRSFCRMLVLGLVVLSFDAAAQPFTFTVIETDLAALEYGSLAYADLDRDGDLDLVATGNSSTTMPFRPTSYVAMSLAEQILGSGETAQWRRTFDLRPLSTQVWHSDVAWTDYDRDGDLDFVLTGTTRPTEPFEAVTRLYENDGAGAFHEVDAGLIGVYGSAAAWGDYDNDGRPDLLIMGATTSETSATRLYRNEGDGAFAGVDVPFRNVAFGDAQWGDYDNDGDLDLVLSGAEPAGGFATQLYRNDGNGSFTDVGADLADLAFSSLDWGDYDDDGDLDLVLSGGLLSVAHFMDGVTEIYRNDGGQLTRINTDIESLLYGRVAWGDYDNDGDLDLLLTGSTDMENGRASRIYRNEDGVFVRRVALVGTAATSAAWGDYDDDGDLDVVLSGSDISLNPLIRLYRNDQLFVNTRPATPTGLQAGVQGNTATLSWNRATDDQTADAGLTYTVRVGTAPGGSNVVSPPASGTSGQRWVPARGNVEHNTSWTLTNLPRGTYYWSVQAVDHSFKGSPFAEEGSFTVSAHAEVGTGTDDAGALPARYALHPAYPNPFRETTTLAYDLPEPGPVLITMYNVLGAEVGRLVDQVQAAGRRHVVWDGRDTSGRRVGAGVYFARMRAGHAMWTQTLIVVP
ncbi:MAG: FG-GAP-like repeat-containing protein [Rhodothermales bacterium]